MTSRAFADHPPFRYDDYRSTIKRGVEHALVPIPLTLSEITGPGPVQVGMANDDTDLTTNAGTGSPALGPRTIVSGRVLDEDGTPLPGCAVEIWQADSNGRYAHWRETDYPAPLDPNFIGVGRSTTDADGIYRFTTIRPGPYPWGNHPNAWRPAHIHFSILGPSLGSRLVTQMYFPGDPLLDLDPIFRSVPVHSRHRMVSTYDHALTEANWALGYRFDIVVRGAAATPFETDGAHH